MTGKQKEARLNQLYEKAISMHLQKMDFDVWDWLTEKETKEYEDLMIETGQASREDFE